MFADVVMPKWTASHLLTDGQAVAESSGRTHNWASRRLLPQPTRRTGFLVPDRDGTQADVARPV